MSIDWTHFTPWAALGGGALIGLASVALVVLLGRIAGISGIVGEVLRRPVFDWRAAFLCGLIAAPVIFRLAGGVTDVRFVAGWPLIAAAGMLVGYGSRMGSGCTSGHGVCGLSRLSARSLVATTTFMTTGILATFVIRHVLKV